MRLFSNTAENRKRWAEHPPITKKTTVLEEKNEIIPPEPPRVKRGRTNVQTLFTRYKGYRGEKWQPQCANRGCMKKLRRDQAIACGPACADALFQRAMDILVRLEVSTNDIIAYVEGVKKAG